VLDERQYFVDGARNQLHARVARLPHAGLLSLLFPAPESRGDFEAAPPEPIAVDRDRDGIGVSWFVLQGNAVERDRAPGRIDGIVEVAEVARLFAETAGDIRIRPFLEGRRDERPADQNQRGRDYNPLHQEDIMRVKAFALLVLAAASVTALQALPAISDSVDVKIDEWMTPSKPAYPHDPAVAPDGSVWYTAQRASTIGRFDPATEQFKEFALPTPSSGPHGLQADKDGNIWYTGNAAGLIGKVDPKTGKVTEYKMPNPKARDPHTIAILPDGRLFFTVQAGNFIGTLDPKAPDGAIKLVESPTVNSRPYGVRLTSKGVPFFDEFNSNKIASADPKTLVITEYPLPNKDARPRRIAIGKDDTVWYGDYARGFLGHLDPKTGKVEEFASPGGPDSKPYAIDVTSDGAIWYVETGDDAKNVLVRFNPETKKFLTWPIPSGGGTVRNMEIDKKGDLWLACSGVGKIARVRVTAGKGTL
jgi:virginiamycin B lyase